MSTAAFFHDKEDDAMIVQNIHKLYDDAEDGDDFIMMEAKRMVSLPQMFKKHVPISFRRRSTYHWKALDEKSPKPLCRWFGF